MKEHYYPIELEWRNFGVITEIIEPVDSDDFKSIKIKQINPLDPNDIIYNNLAVSNCSFEPQVGDEVEIFISDDGWPVDKVMKA